MSPGYAYLDSLNLDCVGIGYHFTCDLMIRFDQAMFIVFRPNTFLKDVTKFLEVAAGISC